MDYTSLQVKGVLFVEYRSVQPIRPGQPAPQLQSQTTSVLPVVATFVPRSAWSVTSGHTETSQQRRRKSWSSSCNDGRTPFLEYMEFVLYKFQLLLLLLILLFLPLKIGGYHSFQVFTFLCDLFN